MDTFSSYPSTTKDRILAGIVRMILGRDLEHGWQRWSVRVNHMTNQFGVVLVDQNDVDIVTLQETLETILDFTDGSVCLIFIFLWNTQLVIVCEHAYFVQHVLTLVDDHEIWMTILVDLTDSAQKETYTSVLWCGCDLMDREKWLEQQIKNQNKS